VKLFTECMGKRRGDQVSQYVVNSAEDWLVQELRQDPDTWRTDYLELLFDMAGFNR